MPIVGDARHVIDELIAAVAAEHKAGHRADLADWWAQLDDLRERYPLGYDEPADGTLAPQYVIKRLGEIAGPDAIYVAGVGQHQMWAAQFISYEKPATWLNSGGLGTMGYAVPAAMGAKVGRPDTVVWAIDGDGCFQMTNQELATCALEGIPIKVAVINNGNLGMVRQWQTLFYDERYSNTDLGTHKHRIPDFVKLAEALGCVGLRCEIAADVDKHDRGRDGDQRRARWWSTSWSARTPWCGRWSPPAPATTRSCSPAASGPTSTRMTCEHDAKHTLSVLVENKPGVLARVAGLFSRRGFNIDSLAVGETEHPEVSRITIVVNAEDSPAGAGHQAAQQAGQRAEDRRAGAGGVGAARAAAGQGAGRPAGAVAGARDGRSCSGPRSSTSPRTRSPSRRPAPPTSSTRCCATSSRTESRKWCSPAWSPSAAAPARSPPARRCAPPPEACRHDADLHRRKGST